MSHAPHHQKTAGCLDQNMRRSDRKADGRRPGHQSQGRGVPQVQAAGKAWHGWLLGCYVALACFAGGHLAAQPEPVVVTVPPRTNLLWNYSPTPGVTNYIVSVSNQFGYFIASVGNTNFWGGVITSRVPTRVVAYAQGPGVLGSVPAITNFFMPLFVRYEVFAQTGSLSGFTDWKSLGWITNPPGLLFRLRAAVTVTNTP